MRNYRDHRELKQYVKSNIGIFLGCGPSINNISNKQWEVINQHDVWASNFFIWHDFVPNFYHAEVGTKFSKLWKCKLYEKGNLYKDVKFILYKDNPNDPIIELTPNVFVYKKREVIKNNYKCILSDNYLTHSNNASLTLILDLMRQMGYEKIILFGVDLKTSAYFWTDRKEYGEVPWQTNKNVNSILPHSTMDATKSFTNIFNKKHMNGNLYVGHKETLLYPQLQYINIRKL